MDLRLVEGYRASEELERLFLGELLELCPWDLQEYDLGPGGPRLLPRVLDWELLGGGPNLCTMSWLPFFGDLGKILEPE